MEQSLIIQRFGKAARTYNKQALAQQLIARKMMTLIREQIPLAKGGQILEVGSGTGFLSKLLLHYLHPKRLLLNDLSPLMEEQCTYLSAPNVHFLCGDAEKLDFPHGLDLIASTSTVQWFTSPEAFFERCSKLLLPGGYLAFSTFGGKNLYEVTSITGQSLDYLSRKELIELLSTQYEIIHSEEELIPLRFNDPKEVLYHLKGTGVTAVSRYRWTKGRLDNFYTTYNDRYRAASNVMLTYHPIYIIAKLKQDLK